jgi:hypothetical protein
MPTSPIDLTGRRFGRLTVVALDPIRAPDRQARWLCRCDCGNTIITKAGHLKSGGSASCTSGGCLKDKASKHPLYRRWLNMIGRCTKPNHPDWENYGARGISVCERWLTFENYISRPGLEMDRDDNDGNYEPGNCFWRTPKENANNRRATIFVETPFGRLCQSDAAERAGLPLDVFDNRRRKGWSIERLFGSVPVKPRPTPSSRA